MDFPTTIESSGLRLCRGIESSVTDMVATEAPIALEFNSGVHAAAFADQEGRILFLREDVGRHRCSMAMAQKAVVAGFPSLAAISAPTSMAISLAKTSGLTLACFVRESGFTAYARPERIVLP